MDIYLELSSRLSETSPKSLMSSISKSGKDYYVKLRELLIEKTSYLKEDCNISERVYHIIHQLNSRPACNCGNFLKYMDLSHGYRTFCSVKCSLSNKEVLEKINKFKSTPEFKEKMRKLAKAKVIGYGCKGHENAMIDKYGVKNISQTEEIKKKKSDQNKKGIIGYSSQGFKEQMIKRFGVENVSQNTDIQQNKKIGNTWKNYVFPSGRIERIQGYENFALDHLLFLYEESDILCNLKEIEKHTGKINYSENGKIRRYYPDFFIISENLIVEAKSIWTFRSKIENNLLKKTAVENLGIKFEFMIFDHNGNNVPHSQDTQRNS